MIEPEHPGLPIVRDVYKRQALNPSYAKYNHANYR